MGYLLQGQENIVTVNGSQSNETKVPQSKKWPMRVSVATKRSANGYVAMD